MKEFKRREPSGLELLKTRVRADLALEIKKIETLSMKHAEEIKKLVEWIKPRVVKDVQILEGKVPAYEYERIVPAKKQLFSKYRNLAKTKLEELEKARRTLYQVIETRILNESMMFVRERNDTREIALMLEYIKELTAEVSLASRSAEVMLESSLKEMENLFEKLDE